MQNWPGQPPALFSTSSKSQGRFPVSRFPHRLMHNEDCISRLNSEVCFLPKTKGEKTSNPECRQVPGGTESSVLEKLLVAFVELPWFIAETNIKHSSVLTIPLAFKEKNSRKQE